MTDTKLLPCPAKMSQMNKDLTEILAQIRRMKVIFQALESVASAAAPIAAHFNRDESHVTDQEAERLQDALAELERVRREGR